MNKFLQILAVILVFSKGNADQFIILKSPKAIEFKSNSGIVSENIQDVYSASLGFSVPMSVENGNWDGLVISDPFNLAQGILTIVVEGLDSLNIKGAKSYEVYGNGDPVTSTLDEIHRHDGTSVDLDLKSDVGKTLETVYGVIVPKATRKTIYLKPKVNKEDQDFLNQIAIVDGLKEMLMENNNHVPTATVIRISLSALLKTNDHGTPEYNEAVKILKNTIDELALVGEKAYRNNALITVITTAQTVNSRVRRATSEDDKKYNIAEAYDENYPVIFNIIFWFSVVMIFALLAISMAIGYMDPGRDSIIYRMTSTRMKKDN